MQNSISTTGRLRLTSFPDLEPALLSAQSAPRPRVTKPARANFTLPRCVYQAGALLLIVLSSIGSYLVISQYFLQEVEVVGESMVPTLRDHDHYLLNRWAFRHHNPRVSDVVVIVDPDDQKLAVKRIVAVAGDSICFKRGRVYVNGGELPEPYLSPNTPTFANSTARGQTIVCGKNDYFVLGDNRMKSVDSRYFGPVPRDNILGLLSVN